MIQLIEKGQQGFPFGTLAYLPDNWQGKPSLISMHGRGQSGDGLKASLQKYQADQSQLPYLLNQPKGLNINGGYLPDFPIFMPLLPEDYTLEGAALEKYRVAVTTFAGNQSVALMGLSFGGQATWKARMEQTENSKYKCFIPICGPYNASKSFPKTNAPTWVFAGEEDKVSAPNVNVWNAGLLQRDKEGIVKELNIPKSTSLISYLTNISEDIEAIFNDLFQNWNIIEPEMRWYSSDAITIYANKGHDVWYKTWNRADLWEFIRYNLFTDYEAPPVEPERPLKDVSDGELSILSTEAIHGNLSVQSQEVVGDEFDLRLAEILKKYNL